MNIKLPIDSVLPQLVEALKTHASVVLEAPPGAGKSTRVPSAILDSGAFPGKIVMLEPRRIAARAIASRIAFERGSKVGGEVGYQVRFDNKVSQNTKIAVVTEGIVTRRLLRDPFLEDVSVVILDEFHERSIHADLAIAFLKEVQAVRDDFKIVVMSATLGTEQVAEYLDAAIVSSPGRLFPLEISNVKKPVEDLSLGIHAGLQTLVESADDDGGDVLVFLPSARAIDDAAAWLKSRWKEFEIVPLYGALDAKAQDRAIMSGDRRKVVLSTNIAETSLTIEGVSAVIDSGLVRRVFASKSTGFDELIEGRISMASATQRAGRAGRLRPGRVIRLWTKVEEHRFTDYEIPEIRRVELGRVALEVMKWSGKTTLDFDWFEAPRQDQLERAESLLEALGFVETKMVSAAGAKALEMPLHPRLAAILLAGEKRGVGVMAATACAIASEPDFVRRVDSSASPVRSDVLMRCELLQDAAEGRTRQCESKGYSVHVGRARGVQEVVKRLKKWVKTNRRSDEDTLKAIGAGFPDRICFKRARNYAASGGDSVVLGRESRVDSGCFVAITIFGTTKKNEGMVRIASEFRAKWLRDVFGEGGDEVAIEWDSKLSRVVARQEHRYMGVKINSKPIGLPPARADEVASLLAKNAALSLVNAFGLDKDGIQFMARIEFARMHMPDAGFPALTGDDGQAFLTPLCYEATRFSELAKKDFQRLAKAFLTPEQRRLLGSEAPDRMEIPSGSKIRIDYSDLERPVLAARIQELFGWRVTPQIGGGKIPLTIHLLAPNNRPAQVTQDLESFWTNTYVEVRKDLLGRYPRHSWPKDPLTAKAKRK